MITLLLGVLGFSASTISFYQAWAAAKRPATLHIY